MRILVIFLKWLVEYVPAILKQYIFANFAQTFFYNPLHFKSLLRRLLNSLLTLCTVVHVKQKGASHCLHIPFVNKCLEKFSIRRRYVVNFSCNIVYETEEKVKQPAAAHVSYSSMVLQCVRSVFPDTWCNTSMIC